MGRLLKFRNRASQDSGDDQWMFKGLEGLAVAIEDLDPAATAAGLNRTTIQFQIEKQLAESGIVVAPLGAIENSDKFAVFYVSIGADGDDTIAFSASFQVCESATLVRSLDQGGGVITWMTEGVWLSSRADLERDASAAIAEGVARLASTFAGAETHSE